ncbi:tyrosine--trna ligase precursor, mitochondrial (cyt-18) [Cryphonectria parasitica EP155]|uniref:Tyrosine--tRNA ligase n=1 Tax=Cryphonectria parasitica (strain ATCC 38755 / EP155) TaxID=660469 RepID=A0A9P4Y202_CRYP1|nr:tyrosine--trna ligase precursor, mitochondrial (cyt-18) [Cryphonectria parasitica EP155]KAF3764700.1 tyrosine--trna ligase precursor, mitochondrial (cyt-18) [Cryphonectria parasitica EP155]
MAQLTSLYKSLPARALLCRDCLWARTLKSAFPQRRWVGTKFMAKLVAADEDWRHMAQEISQGRRTHIFDEFEERGFVKDVVGTRQHIKETMRRKRIGAYCGVDPTAPSLHLGHLVAFMPIFWMYLHGFGSFILIGGSTAKIGDPTGRTESRPEIRSAQLVQNLASIQYQLKAVWEHVEENGRRFGFKRDWAWRRGVINNNAWWNKLPMLDVLKRLGSQVRLGPMLGRDNVKKRIDDGTGMSFAEFSYPLMQAWDWYELFKQRTVQLQIGGSDQYGNILTGAQAVKYCIENEPDPAKKLPHGEFDQPIGFTVPLLTDSAGTKFGKSAGNAIWLDPFKTSPFDMYGYLVRRPDDDVERLLKLLTFFPLSDIAKFMEEHKTNPPKRVAQHLLAYEVTALVHGTQVAQRTQAEHRTRYGGNKDIPLNTGQIEQSNEQYQAVQGHPTTIDNRPRIDQKLPYSIVEMSLARIVFAAGLATSVSDADRTIKNGGIYIGGAPGQKGHVNKGMNPEQLMFTPVTTWPNAANRNFLIDDKILLLRKGKHNLRCIELISDDEWAKSGKEYPGQPFTGAFRKAMSKVRHMVEEARMKKANEGGMISPEDVVDVSQLPAPTQAVTHLAAGAGCRSSMVC